MSYESFREHNYEQEDVELEKVYPPKNTIEGRKAGIEILIAGFDSAETPELRNMREQIFIDGKVDEMRESEWMKALEEATDLVETEPGTDQFARLQVSNILNQALLHLEGRDYEKYDATIGYAVQYALGIGDIGVANLLISYTGDEHKEYWRPSEQDDIDFFEDAANDVMKEMYGEPGPADEDDTFNDGYNPDDDHMK